MRAFNLSQTWLPANLTASQQSTKLTAPDWYQCWRDQQLQAFIATGFPTTHEEDWKYTSLRHLAEQEFQIQVPSPVTIDVSQYLLADCYPVVMINGRFDRELSAKDLPNAVVICDLASALQQHPEAYKALMQQLPLTPMAALSIGLASQGVFIDVPANVTLDKPIHFIHVCSGIATPNSYNLQHLVRMQANSEITLIEEYIGDDCQRYFNNVTSDLQLAADARLSHFKIQREGHQAYHVAATHVSLQQNSRVKSMSLSLGALLARDDLSFDLNASAAACELLGLYQLHDEQHIDHHTRINHNKDHTVSRQHYRGMIDGKAHSVFNGKVIVHEHAVKSSAQQLNKNLLLSNAAAADTKPELEIYNDDVSCSHGATVGELDRRALFYLRSRGIAEPIARQLLIRGFVAELLEQLPQNVIGEHIHSLVMARLQHKQESDND